VIEKKLLANITTFVALGNTAFRSYATFSSIKEGNFGQSFRHAACGLIEVVISGCFINASALTGDDDKDQENAETFSYFAIAASAAKLIIDLVFDCIEIHNQLKNQDIQNVSFDLEAGGPQPRNLIIAQRDQFKNQLIEERANNDRLQRRVTTTEEQLTDECAKNDRLQRQLLGNQGQLEIDLNQGDKRGAIRRPNALSKQIDQDIGMREVGVDTPTSQIPINSIIDKLQYFHVGNSEFLQKESRSYDFINYGNRDLIEKEYPSAFTHFTEAFDLNKKLSRNAGQAISLDLLGQSYKESARGENRNIKLDQARQCFEEALIINKKIGRKEGQAANHRSIGSVLLLQGDNNDAAVQSYDEAIKIYEYLGFLDDTMKEDLGWIKGYKDLGNPSEAIQYYENIFESIDQSDEKLEREIDRQSHIAVEHHLKPNLPDAILAYNKALRIATYLTLREDIASINGHLGLAYQDAKEIDLAITSYKEALKMDDEIGARTTGVANTLSNLGNCYWMKGNENKDIRYHDLAIKFHEKALKINTDIKAVNGKASNIANLGSLYAIKDLPGMAWKCYKEAEKLFEDNEFSHRADIVRSYLNELSNQPVPSKTKDV